jgi:hypothetical protein
MIPGLIDAFVIERETAGEVPVASWLGTDLARYQLATMGTNWHILTEQRASEMARNTPKRRGKST